jgi:molybdate-binding protein
MKQLVDFKGLAIDGSIYPTDIDGLIEYKDSKYIIFEIKYGDADVPFGQRLALQRMVDDFIKVGKQAVAFICEHAVRDTHKPVVAAWCKVREIYDGLENKWYTPHETMSVRDAVDKFQRHSNFI